MSILSNPFLLRKKATADTAYQIEKSLRFNDPDTPKLTKTSGKGDTKKWTYSTWVKRGKITDQAPILSGKTSPYQDIYFTSGDAIACYIDSPNVNVSTNRLFRDPGAWMHIVIVWDTAQSTDSDRIRFYINGKRETSFNATTWPAQNAESVFNREGKDNAIFHGLTTSNDHFDGYGADPIFIDGLALPPTAFGSFDDAGNWNPKTFALPVINTGVTWSSNLTSSTGSFYGADNPKEAIFNGDLTHGTDPSTNTGTITFTPSSSISYGIEVKLHSSHTEFQASTAVITHDDDTTTTTTLTGNKNPIIATGKGTIKSLAVTCNSGWLNWSGISIDDTLLIDGHKDPETRVNPNNGRNWSDEIVGSVYSGSFSTGQMFNGSLNSGTGGATMPADSSTLVWTPSGGINAGTGGVIRIRIFRVGTSALFKVNDVDQKSDLHSKTGNEVGGGEWYILPVTNLTKLEWGRDGSGDYRIGAVEVNGVRLQNENLDQSFHLKFNDTSSNAAIGYDSLKTFSDSSFKAINGAPILKTNHDGSAVTSGYRTDDNSANLLLALPLNNLNDVHGSIQGNASNNISMTNDGVASETSTTKYYGTCQDWASGDRLYTASDSSLAWGTGNFTIEGWFNWDNNYAGSWGSNRKYLFDNQTASTSDYEYVRMFADGGTDSAGDGTILKTMNASGSDVTVQELNKNQWYHIAMVRSGSTMKIYVDGVEKVSQTYANDITGTIFTVGAYHDDSGGWWSGKIQDFKIYNTAVYTAGFSPVKAPNDWTVTNLTEAASAVYATPNENDIDSSGNLANGGTPYIIDCSPASRSFQHYSVGGYEIFDNDGGSGNNCYMTGSSNSPGSPDIWRLDLRDFDTVTSVRLNYAGGQAYNASYNSAYAELQDSSKSTISGSRVELSSYDYGWSTLPVSGSPRYIKFDADGETDFRLWLSMIEVNGTVLTNGSHAYEVDVFNDSPTNYEDSSSNVHGNFCTLNPLSSAPDFEFSQGNLHVQSSGSGANSNHYGHGFG